jgi:peptidoglycan/LPS O-acetylase OafA/YrhL
MKTSAHPTIVDKLLARLSRVTSGGAFILEVDGLRFIAIMAVVFFHLSGYVSQRGPSAGSGGLLRLALEQGHYGVQLFFVISGFILALPFAEHYLGRRGIPPLGKYFVRRITRLEPPYIANLLLAFALLIIAKRLSAAALVPHLAASIVYLHNVIFGTGSTINFVAWSLEIEVQFYVLAPLINLVFLIRSSGIRRMVVMIAALGCAHLFRSGTWSISLPGQVQYFLAGTLLADVFLVDWQRSPARGFAWDAIGTLAWAGIVVVAAREYAVAMLLPVCVLVAYIGTFRGRIWNRIVTNRWLVVVGGMCYTIYLYHYLIISAVGRVTVHVNLGTGYLRSLMVQSALILPVILGASAVMFAMLERPFMNKDWPSRLRTRLVRLFGETPAGSTIPPRES